MSSVVCLNQTNKLLTGRLLFSANVKIYMYIYIYIFKFESEMRVYPKSGKVKCCLHLMLTKEPLSGGNLTDGGNPDLRRRG
jgi:hypothetical protein